MSPVIGLDVGGANLKAALVDPDGGGIRQASEPFAVWRDPDGLAAAIARVLGALGAPPGVDIAATMTAELADCFPGRAEGVRAVLAALRSAAGDGGVRVLRVDGALVSLDAAGADPLPCAAANWVASARLAARTLPDGILADCGSTTTDLIPLRAGSVAARGVSDLTRLAAGELVYTGAHRTDVAAVVHGVRLGDVRCPVAAEAFAVSADAHLRRGALTPSELPVGFTFPDGRGPGPADVARRLARVLCADPDELGEAGIDAVAAAMWNGQVTAIARGLAQVAGRVVPGAPVLCVGVGGFLTRAAAERAGLPVGSAEAAGALAGAGGDVAPAVALSVLGAER